LNIVCDCIGKVRVGLRRRVLRKNESREQITEEVEVDEEREEERRVGSGVGVYFIIITSEANIDGRMKGLELKDKRERL